MAIGPAPLLAPRLASYPAIRVSNQGLATQPGELLHLVEQLTAFLSIRAEGIRFLSHPQILVPLINRHSLFVRRSSLGETFGI